MVSLGQLMNISGRYYLLFRRINRLILLGRFDAIYFTFFVDGTEDSSPDLYKYRVTRLVFVTRVGPRHAECFWLAFVVLTLM